MACAQCSSGSSVSYSSGSYSSGATCGCGNPVAPPRSSNPPVIPVTYPWIARVRNLLCGKMLIAKGDEIAALDSSISGQLIYDAPTQTVSVGTVPVEWIPDNFNCEENVTGFPAYGVTPSCRDLGEYPDRQLAFLRPPDSDTGTLYGHMTVCPTRAGLAPEIRPVQIVPAAFPTEAPTGLFNLAFVDVPANGCTPSSRKWYAVPPQDANAVDLDDIEMFELPEGPYTAANDADFGLAVWVKNDAGTKWVLEKVTNESLQELFGTGSPNTFVRPRPNIYSQVRVGGAAVTPVNQNLNLTTVANYDAKYTGVMLTINLQGYNGTRNFDITVLIDDELFAQIKLGGVDTQSSGCVNTFTVPIPASKQLNLKMYETTEVVGTYNSFSVDVMVDAFVK